MFGARFSRRWVSNWQQEIAVKSIYSAVSILLLHSVHRNVFVMLLIDDIDVVIQSKQMSPKRDRCSSSLENRIRLSVFCELYQMLQMTIYALLLDVV